MNGFLRGCTESFLDTSTMPLLTLGTHLKTSSLHARYPIFSLAVNRSRAFVYSSIRATVGKKAVYIAVLGNGNIPLKACRNSRELLDRLTMFPSLILESMPIIGTAIRAVRMTLESAGASTGCFKSASIFSMAFRDISRASSTIVFMLSFGGNLQLPPDGFTLKFGILNRSSAD
jgi:hypothetical protein